jgi:hypothetical protein
MKRLILLFCIGCCWANIHAQSYHPVIENDKVWLESFNMGVNICNYESVYQLRFGGDTLINDITYRKILSRTYSPTSAGPYCPPFVLNPNWFELNYAFMREDTTARKVYLRIWQGNQFGDDVLLYDFSLQEGDTIQSSAYLTDGADYIITSVEDVMLLNGEMHKKFYHTDGYSFYIEGIGGEYGLFKPFFEGIGFWWKTLCVEQDGVDLYSQGGGNTFCNWLTLDITEKSFPEVSIYPNPSNGTFVMDLGEANIGQNNLQLIVFNAMGQQVFSAPIQSERFHFQLLPIAGIYFWQLQNNTNSVKTGKILVN